MTINMTTCINAFGLHTNILLENKFFSYIHVWNNNCFSIDDSLETLTI